MALNLACAVVRVAFDDGKNTILRPKEPNNLDNAPEESWAEMETLAEVEGKEYEITPSSKPVLVAFNYW
ncbi:hypothetical protein VTJ04DRAFT_6979 [Mycothermus thermophilus]|uniref:uncharacterized protein n=1 Tax=Humicola insolens TaxID=85995 RepID=UPI003743EBDD